MSGNVLLSFSCARDHKAIALNCYCFRFFADVHDQKCHIAAIIISRFYEDQSKLLRL